MLNCTASHLSASRFHSPPTCLRLYWHIRSFTTSPEKSSQPGGGGGGIFKFPLPVALVQARETRQSLLINVTSRCGHGGSLLMVGYILCMAEPVCAKTLNFVFTKVSVSIPFLGVSNTRREPSTFHSFGTCLSKHPTPSNPSSSQPLENIRTPHGMVTNAILPAFSAAAENLESSLSRSRLELRRLLVHLFEETFLLDVQRDICLVLRRYQTRLHGGLRASRSGDVLFAFPVGSAASSRLGPYISIPPVVEKAAGVSARPWWKGALPSGSKETPLWTSSAGST